MYVYIQESDRVGASIVSNNFEWRKSMCNSAKMQGLYKVFFMLFLKKQHACIIFTIIKLKLN